MPGIVGLVTKKSAAQARAEVERMLDAVRHESFYKTGTYCDESLGLYVGWTALENSFSDGMPLCNEQGNVVLIFSGEDYPPGGTIQRVVFDARDLPISVWVGTNDTGATWSDPTGELKTNQNYL